MKCCCLIFVKFKQLYDIQYFLGINIIWSIGVIQKWEGWVKVLWGMGVNESGFSSLTQKQLVICCTLETNLNYRSIIGHWIFIPENCRANFEDYFAVKTDME